MSQSSSAKRYRMLRVREEDYERLRDAQQLLVRKGTDTIDWAAFAEQGYVKPPRGDRSGEDVDPALSYGYVLGVAATALALQVARRLKEQAEE